jgi:hypothetical protein
MEFDPESYEWRINNLLQLIKKQNEQQTKEDNWLDSQNKKHNFNSKKKRKTKTQARKEQLQKLKTQVPKIGNVSKFFNF